MKIQIFSSEFYGYLSHLTSSKIFGGQELLLLETCKLLIEMGHSLEVVQLSDSSDSLVFEGIHVRRIKAPKLLFLQRLGFIRRWTWAGIIFARHIDKSADWIHLHNHHFSFPMVFFKRKSQIMTGMNHGVEWDVPWVYSENSLKNYRDRFSFSLLKMVTRFSIRNLDKVITNDRFMIHFTSHTRPDLSSKFHYIPNYYDERVFCRTHKLKINGETSNKVMEFAREKNSTVA